MLAFRAHLLLLLLLLREAIDTLELLGFVKSLAVVATLLVVTLATATSMLLLRLVEEEASAAH